MTTNAKKIVFIEDEKALTDIYENIFKKEGFIFVSTSDVSKALALTESEQPDAVLLDIIIPIPENTVAEQGYDYLRSVKNNPATKHIPIIIFSNLDTVEDRKKCKEMGAAAYMFKRDCTPKEVTDTVLEVIRRSEQNNV